jgi:hypothetical protein
VKTLMSMTALLALFVVAGCEQTPADRQADAVRENSQHDAQRTREAADAAAARTREQDPAGRDPVGSARTDSIEKKADSIEAQGERKADAIEAEGERKADALEKTRR